MNTRHLEENQNKGGKQLKDLKLKFYLNLKLIVFFQKHFTGMYQLRNQKKDITKIFHDQM